MDDIDELRSYIAHELQQYFYTVNEILGPLGTDERQQENNDILVDLIDYEFEQAHKMPKISKKPDLSSFTVSIIEGLLY